MQNTTETTSGATEIALGQLADIEIDGVDARDYPDFCDAFISRAVWKETGIELTEHELERIPSDEVYAAVMDKLY
jgi:hypothetical protein